MPLKRRGHRGRGRSSSGVAGNAPGGEADDASSDRTHCRQDPLALSAALPLLAWGKPVQMYGPGMQAWAWLDALWRLGTFALLAIAVSLAILARIRHSRALAVITAIYATAVCLTGWLDLQQAIFLPAFYPFGDPAALLPAAVLLLAGLPPERWFCVAVAGPRPAQRGESDAGRGV